MAGLLGEIFSAGNVAKRKLTDLLGNPVLSAQQFMGNLNDRARNLNEMTSAAAREGMDYGPATQRLAGLMADAYNPMGLTVFHGSPAKFNKFDRTKIGSGEGAQAYGYGHYVAESPDVAKQYRDTLADEVVIYKGKTLEQNDPNAFLANFSRGNKTYGQDLIDFFNERVKESKLAIKDKNPDWRTKATADALQKREELLQASKSFDQNAVEFQNQGSFYEIDLPDDQIAKMLDFDKPLMQQSKEIQNLAKQYGLTDADHMGGDLIAAMDAKRSVGAEAMRQAGVPGIRYLDQGSRGIGEGTSNFVVFPGNEDLLTILKRNGGLLD